MRFNAWAADSLGVIVNRLSISVAVNVRRNGGPDILQIITDEWEQAQAERGAE